MLVDEVNNGCKDAEPFVICDSTIAQRYWSKDAHLLDEYLNRILITFEGNLGWLEYVPIVAPDEADQLGGITISFDGMKGPSHPQLLQKTKYPSVSSSEDLALPRGCEILLLQ